MRVLSPGPGVDQALRLAYSLVEDKTIITFVKRRRSGFAMHAPDGTLGGDDVLTELSQNFVSLDRLGEEALSSGDLTDALGIRGHETSCPWGNNEECVAFGGEYPIPSAGDVIGSYKSIAAVRLPFQHHKEAYSENEVELSGDLLEPLFPPRSGQRFNKRDPERIGSLPEK